MAILPHDASGFLVGERLVNGIDLVGKDTTEILKILKSSIGLQQASNNRLRVTLDWINNQSQRRVIDVTPTPLPVHRIGNNSQQLPTVDIGAPTSDVQPIPPTIEHGHDSGRVDDARLSDIDNPIPTPNENTNGSPTPPIQDIEPALPPAPLDDGRRNNGHSNSPPSDDPDSNNNNRHGNGRRRNARGQFEGDNAPPTDDPTPDDGRRNNGRRRNSRGQFEGDGSGGLINGIKNAIRSGFALGNADTQNIDPTVDAVRELSDLMSPLAKVGKTMFKGAAWLFRRKKKREEPSDQEQRQQSRIEKLLKRIAGSRVGQAAGSGFNLFGGLFSSLTGTAGSLLSGLGKILTGAILPALGLTAAFKFGEWVGGKIYDAIEPALSSTIDAVMAIPEKISKAWDSVVAAASNGIEAIVNYVKEKKDKAKGVYEQAISNTADNFEKADKATKGVWETGKGVYKQAVENTADNFGKAAKATKGALELGKGVYKQAVSNMTDKMEDVFSGGSQTPISKVNTAGKGFNETQLADGSVVKRTGSRNWRNNNPGNIEYGDFAKKHGAIGSDGRFAVFPTYEAGRSAKSDLIFNGKNYKDLDLMGAINRYAPPKENDTAKYQRTVLKAVGGANKRMADYTPQERERIMDAMEKMEGFKAGKTEIVKAADKTTSTMPTVSAMVQAPLNAVNAVNGGMTSTVSAKTFAPAIPTTVPKLLARPLPETPKVKQQVSTKEQPPMKVSVVDGGSTIGQNVSDRHLAHAVTGGLGMDALRMG